MSDTSTDPLPGELGRFLRARRERTSPRQVGLPDSGRRRTPGLRREEVATLAGVSVDYLVRLEQGRDVHPSPDILAALAGAMRMTDDERRHLHHLGMRSGNEARCESASPPPTVVVAPTVSALLGALDPLPAFVVGPAGDVLAWNDAWAAVGRGIGLLDGSSERPPNLARFVFTHRAARAVLPEWRAAADEHVARLRRAVTIWSHEPSLVALVAELGAEPEFAARWAAHPVGGKRRGRQRFAHPEVGDLGIAYEVLDLVEDGGQQLITWLPADDETDRRLAALTGPPRLRLVEPG